MAYRAINDSELTVDSPVDTALVTALRDNCIAIPQALSGAPKVALAAIDDIRGGAAYSGQLNADALGNGKIFNQMDIVHQLRCSGGQITGFGNSNTLVNTGLGYTVQKSGTYSMVLQGFGNQFVARNLIAEILINDTSVTSDTSVEFSAGSGSTAVQVQAIDVIHEIQLTAGQVVKLKVTANSLGTFGGGQYYSVIVSFVATNYMVETIGICSSSNQEGTDQQSTTPAITNFTLPLQPDSRLIH